MTNNVPKPLEKDGVEAIRAGDFLWLKRKNSLLNFTASDLSWDGLEDMRRNGLEVMRGDGDDGDQDSFQGVELREVGKDRGFNLHQIIGPIAHYIF